MDKHKKIQIWLLVILATLAAKNAKFRAGFSSLPVFWQLAGFLLIFVGISAVLLHSFGFI